MQKREDLNRLFGRYLKEKDADYKLVQDDMIRIRDHNCIYGPVDVIVNFGIATDGSDYVSVYSFQVGHVESEKLAAAYELCNKLNHASST